MDGLELGYCRRGGVGEPDWTGIGEERLNERFESDDESFLAGAPVGASKGSKNVKAGGSTRDDG